MGWCPPPPNIAFRFKVDDWGSVDLMHNLEETFVLVHKAAATVVEPAGLVKWLAEVDIGIMSLLYQVRKNIKISQSAM